MAPVHAAFRRAAPKGIIQQLLNLVPYEDCTLRLRCHNRGERAQASREFAGIAIK